MSTNMKMLHNIYDEGATIISSSGTEWKRFLTFAKDVHKYNFDSNIFIYIQRPKVTALATADIWKKLGRNVLEGSKSVVIPNFSTKKQEYFFDISQTVGKPIDLSMWKFEQEDYKLLEEFLTAEKNDYKNHQELLKGIEKAIADKVYEQLKPDVDNRKSLLAYFSVLYLVHEKLELPMFNVAKSDYYLNSIVKEVSTLEELRTLGNYVLNNAKSILSEIERWKKQVNQEKEEQKHEYRNGQIKGEHQLHERGRRISVSEHSNGHRGESKEVWRSGENLHGRESSRPIHLSGSEREANSNTNENGGRSVQSYGEVRRAVGEGISKARDRQYSGSNSTSQPIEKYSGRNRNEGNSPSSTLMETALVENETSAVFHSNNVEEKEVLQNREEELNVSIEVQSMEDSLQLSFFPSEDKEHTVETTEEVLPPFSERLLPGVLRYDALMSVKKTAIEAYFKEHSSPIERAKFLSKAYNKDYSIFSIDTSKRRVGYHLEEKGLYIWEGQFLTRTSGSLYSWNQLQDYITTLIESGAYLTDSLLEKDFVAKDNSNVLLEQKGNEDTIHNYYREQENPYPKGSKSKYQGNVAAIKLLKKLENESRLPSKEEQQVLARYVGWGGLANAFSPDYDEWKNEYQELKKLLTEGEYGSARTSTLTAYYTEPFIIKQIYDTLERFGFKGGNILDPAMGTGNFFSMLPKGLRNSSLTGVELDSISGRISKMLYPEANISVQGYEHSDIADNSMDVVVGNIPFNNFSISDKRYKKDYLIHDYFFKRSLDIVKPNGIVAFITSSGTLDKKEITSRLELFEQADLIGAVRLPVNVFGEIAGTSVTTDILLFQKREKTINQLREEGEVITSPNWVYTNVSPNESKSPLNRYFVENPSMILGDFQTKNFRGLTVEVVDKNYDKVIFEQKLEQALSTIQPNQSLEKLEVQSMTSETKNTALGVSIPSEKNEELPDISSVRPYTYIVNNDDIYYVDGARFVKQQVGKTIANRIKGMVQVKEALLEVMNIQAGVYIESDLTMVLEKLNHVYDQFVEKYDVINSKANMQAFRQDDQLPLLRAIEVMNKHSGKYEKAKVFFEATIKPIQKIENVDNAQEALIYSLNEVGKVDFSIMQKVYNLEEGKMIEELKGHIFFEPVTEHLLNGEIRGNWVTREAYLSGDVKTKLDVAKKLSNLDGKYTHNVEELEKVIPEDLKPSEIGFKLGSIWIPIQYVEQFMYETMETANYNRFGRSAIKVHYSDLTTKWNIEGKTLEYNSVKANKTYGTNRMNGYEILEDSLNLQSCTIYDKEYYYENGDRKHRYVLNPKETMLARSKQQLLQEAFSSWLFQDRDRAKELVGLYNERFNRIVPRKYNGDYLTFPNMNKEMKLRPHQKNVVSRIVNNRTALMAHEVGAGKTAAMIASGMYLKRLGTVQKPMYVVPNHLVEQFGMEFLRFFPKANVLMTTKKDFEKQNRKTFVSKIATGNYDAIIIGQSQFERIPLSVERQKSMMKEEINQVKLAIQEVKANDGERWTIKQMELFTKNLESKLEKLNNEDKKDNLLTFEQLGVDFLFVDEAHHYKNCFVYSKMTNVAGISQANSQRATDMLMKCQYMQEINERGGIVFSTGTPISNSMSEMYVMQRYLQPQTLRDMGLSSFDAWASTFGEVVSSLEITPEGSGYKMKSRFAKFHNLPELMNIFYEIADIQTSDMLNLPVPKLVGDKAEIIATEATEYQEMVMESFIERSEIIRAGGVEPSQDNLLKLTHEAKLLAIDPRLFDETAPNDPHSKLNVCINNVHRIWEETKENRSTQIIFCDSGTPKKGRFNVYDEVKRSLVEKGVPSEEIAFIHDAKTEVQRDKMFKKIREGDVRILLGSTSKVGTGTNIQDKLIAGHHADCPWKPSDIIQRDGRVIRQGNENAEVHMYRYVTKGTFDAFLWQIQEQKLGYISQVMTGKNISRDCSDMDETVLTAAEVKAIATNNPLLAEKMTIDNEIGRLKMLKGDWKNTIERLTNDLEVTFPKKETKLENILHLQQIDVKKVEEVQGQNKDFSITLGNKRFDTRKEASEELVSLIGMLKVESGQRKEIGEYKGFKLNVSRPLFETKLELENECIYVSDYNPLKGIGNITRIENTYQSIPSKIEETKSSLEELEKDVQNAKSEIASPFRYEEKLTSLIQQQHDLNYKLELDDLSKSTSQSKVQQR